MVHPILTVVHPLLTVVHPLPSSQVLEASLELETWTPVFATKRISSSLVDLFQCFSQTVVYPLPS